MAGKIINGIKYVELLDLNNLKFQSIQHNIHYTLRDIFWNCSEESDVNKIIYLQNLINKNNDNNCTINDSITNNLKNCRELYSFLNEIDENKFYFNICEDKNVISETASELMLFNVWWLQLQDLLAELKKIIIKLSN